MAIVITGGAGFVGSNLVERLHRQDPNVEVVVLDAMLYPAAAETLRPYVEKNGRFKVVQGSILDSKLLDETLREGDVVFHLAVEYGQPERFIETQIGGVKAVMDAALRRNVARFIYQSTADVYGKNDDDDIQETAPIRPTQIYAATKLGAEALVTAYHHTYGLPIVILRPVSIYGPRQYPAWLISKFITRALSGQSLGVTGTGRVCRDWIHVDDVCEALIATIEHQVSGEVFNIGTGKEYSVLEITKEILRLTGQPESSIVFGPDRPGDFDRQVTTGAKAMRRMGWRARTDFHEGLERTVAWYRANWNWVMTQLSSGQERLGFRITEQTS
jgi:dTDP-glucose 4,6-dehydratase